MNKENELNRNGDKRGMSLNSQKNLLGVQGVGNPKNNHASKDYSITRIIKEMLDNPAEERWLEPEDKHKGYTWRQAIAKRILIEAVRGNAKVTGELLDRLEGKVIQPIEGALEVRNTRDLTDEELTVIAAANIVKNNAFGGSS